MDYSTVLRRSPDVIETSVNSEPVLLHSTRWNYLHFSGSGSAIWGLLVGPVTFGDLIASLHGRFEVSQETCERETGALLQKLIQEQFVIAS